MNNEIGNTVKGDADANVEHEIQALHEASDTKKEHGYTGKHHEEVVILFKEATVVLIMMIFMQIPEKTVHQIFMRQPCYCLHTTECNDDE